MVVHRHWRGNWHHDRQSDFYSIACTNPDPDANPDAQSDANPFADAYSSGHRQP
jgi:hypothetical protein